MTNAIPQNKTILLVEDEAIIAMDLQNRLIASGYETHIAATGEEALTMMASSTPGVLILDKELAGSMDGLEVAKRAREYAAVPVIFLTGCQDEAFLQAARLLNPSACLIKPVSTADLLLAVTVAFSGLPLKSGKSVP